MRVLNITGSLKRGGGIETMLLRALAAIPEVPPAAPLSVEICYIGRREPTMAEEFERIGVPVWRCAESHVPGVFSRRLAAELRSRAPYDVIHTHNSNFGGVALAVARRLGVPRRLAHYHNITSGHANNLSRRLYEWWLRGLVLRHATAICPVSAGLIATRFGARLAGDPRVRVIRAGIPVEQFALTPAARAEARAAIRTELAIPPDAQVIGHVGRFVPQKNHAGLLDAARLVFERVASARLLLVGDGELRPAIEQRAAELGLRERVVFAGVRSDIGRLYAAMDVFSLPSIEEGLGVVLLEAQAVGLPVVASRLVTTQDAVAPEFMRYTRAPADTSGLAAALCEVLEQVRNPRAAAEIAARAQEFGRSFTAAASARAFLDAWGVS